MARFTAVAQIDTDGMQLCEECRTEAHYITIDGLCVGCFEAKVITDADADYTKGDK
jgi:hypothetical protein